VLIGWSLLVTVPAAFVAFAVVLPLALIAVFAVQRRADGS
jgi:hypothetical protein